MGSPAEVSIARSDGKRCLKGQSVQFKKSDAKGKVHAFTVKGTKGVPSFWPNEPPQRSTKSSPCFWLKCSGRLLLFLLAGSSRIAREQSCALTARVRAKVTWRSGSAQYVPVTDEPARRTTPVALRRKPARNCHCRGSLANSPRVPAV